MIIEKCTWERGLFTGLDVDGVIITLEDYKVVNADELRRSVQHRPQDVIFSLQLNGRGMYSSLWNWNFITDDNDGSTDDFQKSPPVCAHEWANQGFHQIVMACKFCGQSAPSWVQTKHDPQS